MAPRTSIRRALLVATVTVARQGQLVAAASYACMPASMPVMGQITARAGNEIVQRVKEAAASQGRSMNDYVTAVLDAATNPDLAGDEASRVRERLARAGLLTPSALRRQRPPARAVAAARIAAGRATSLAELVGQDRQ